MGSARHLQTCQKSCRQAGTPTSIEDPSPPVPTYHHAQDEEELCGAMVKHIYCDSIQLCRSYGRKLSAVSVYLLELHAETVRMRYSTPYNTDMLKRNGGLCNSSDGLGHGYVTGC